MTNDKALEALKTYGRTVLVCADATRGRALEIRKLAKDEGIDIRFRKSAPGVIVLERQFS